ncbi:MAG: cupin domain-containing protein [Alphaproteobacteria bacterium]|nr:cupin domain-containing protein [Alphaproteobacteria bacterium]
MTRPIPTTSEELLMAYAAGRLNTMESLLAATLLSVNAAARQQLALYEAQGGHVLDEEEPSDLCHSCLESVLQRIDDQPVRAVPTPCPDMPGVPEPLCTLLRECMTPDSLCWKAVSPGMECLPLTVDCAGPQQLFLMKLAPHESAPSHRHDGTEITLVLEGYYTDTLGRHEAGSMCIITDNRIAHSPRAGDKGCLCLVLTAQPLRYRVIRQRFFTIFRR